VNDPVRLLMSLGQALSVMRFYDDGHPARERATHGAYQEIVDLMDRDPAPRFTFVEGEAVYHRLLLRELRDWDWAAKLEAAGIQRLEFLPGLTYEDFDRFLHDVVERMNGGAGWNSVTRQFAPTSIRYGPVGFRNAEDEPAVRDLAGVALSLENEIAAVEWIHRQVEERRQLPLLEAEVVVRSLALAIHEESQVVLPLLRLKQFDQYTTTHSCNVAVLATAFAEHLGYEPAHARALGVCGLLHDIGKVWIPREVLVKPGQLTPDERKIIERHPVEGARILIERERNLELAAVVSFEHHRWIDGRGYPGVRTGRPCHHASRLVQICDVFDALCTDRPYRPGLRPEDALAQIEAEAGDHFDAPLVHAFAGMVRGSLIRFMPLDNPDPRQPEETVAVRPDANGNADSDDGPGPDAAPASTASIVVPTPEPADDGDDRPDQEPDRDDLPDTIDHTEVTRPGL